VKKVSGAIIIALSAALVVVSVAFAVVANTLLTAPKAAIDETRIIASAASNSTTPSFLFVQSAASGTLTQQDGTYKLTLDDVSSTTVSFTDRPQRVVDKIPTHDFINEWTVGSDSFASDPPNGALVIYEGSMEDILVLELRNPLYGNGTIQYEVSVLSNDGIISTNANGTLLPSGPISYTFAPVALFIDGAFSSYSDGYNYGYSTGRDDCLDNYSYNDEDDFPDPSQSFDDGYKAGYADGYNYHNDAYVDCHDELD
jgi:hypothetical protein